MVSVHNMVEKPKLGMAPSNLAVIGRYILSPNVLTALDGAASGEGGEIQLTDAISNQCHEHGDVYGYRFKGRRYDCGSKAGFLQATIAFGLERPDLRKELCSYLDEIMAARDTGE